MQTRTLTQYLEYLKLSGIENIFLNPEIIQQTSEEIIKYKKMQLLGLEENYQDCKKCLLSQSRIKFVYGEGNPDSKLMLIGEAPGADENITGRPFVGKAGQLLTRMLQAINLERSDIYITNVVKCRPPNNRNPLPAEINSCLKYLDEQISIIKPKLLLLLGKVAATSLLNESMTLTLFREKTYLYKGIKTYVTYHPSALLRNPGWKKYAWIDLQKLRDDYIKL
ncbi:MAG TPA: uracil-DNA glycosylase [Candidatus Cloacimonetes bacterium]|nr:uracil-DNA glycosylase [Candidatus Cloacimonadota bacterium]